MTMRPPASLALHLGLGYALLILYASLYPLTGWRDSGASPIDFLLAGWPRYTTPFDMATNLAAYVPLGFTMAAAWRRHSGAAAAIVLTVLLATVLSLTLECLQNYLPGRVASNLDLGGNALGGEEARIHRRLIKPKRLCAILINHGVVPAANVDIFIPRCALNYLCTVQRSR